MDLYAVLMGHPSPPLAAPSGRRLAVVRCSCGRGIASIHAAKIGPELFVNTTRLPPRQVADMVIDAVLIDLDRITEAQDDNDPALLAVEDFLVQLELHGTEALAEVLPALTLPGSGPSALAGLAAAHSAAAGRRLSGLRSTCARCHVTYYIGGELAAWAGSPPPRAAVVMARVVDEWRTRIGADWPPEGKSSRVALYQRLTAVLTSKVQQR